MGCFLSKVKSYTRRSKWDAVSVCHLLRFVTIFKPGEVETVDSDEELEELLFAEK
jgi:hypothetical protein